MASLKNFYSVELNRTEWKVPKRYQKLTPVGSGAYGQVWLVLLTVILIHDHIVGVIILRRSRPGLWGTDYPSFGGPSPSGIWTFRSSALSFPGAKSPQMELSFPWNFVPWNIRPRGAKSARTFVPWNFRSLELSLLGTFAFILKKVGESITALCP